jgi:hypothetical protein
LVKHKKGKNDKNFKTINDDHTSQNTGVNANLRTMIDPDESRPPHPDSASFNSNDISSKNGGMFGKAKKKNQTIPHHSGQKQNYSSNISYNSNENLLAK